MKSVVRRGIVTILMFTFIFSFNVHAQELEKNRNINGSEDDIGILLPPEVSQSADTQYNNARGSLISTATASITNIGGGDIEILLQTVAHHQCDKIRHVGYLERWVEEYGDYEQVARYEFVEYAEDHPDESLYELTTVFNVTDQPSGYTYRVRGAHTVKKDTTSESLSTRTDGVLITK